METIYTEQQKQLDLVDEEDADRDPKEGLVEQLLRQHRESAISIKMLSYCTRIAARPPLSQPDSRKTAVTNSP